MKRLVQSLVLLVVWFLAFVGQAQAVFWCHCCQCVVVGTPECGVSCSSGPGAGIGGCDASAPHGCCAEAECPETPPAAAGSVPEGASACDGDCFRLLMRAPVVELTSETSGLHRLVVPSAGAVSAVFDATCPWTGGFAPATPSADARFWRGCPPGAIPSLRIHGIGVPVFLSVGSLRR